MNPISSLAFSFPTLIITIPSTILVLIWLGSLYGARYALRRFALRLGFVSMFISGGVSGFFPGATSVDIMLHATSSCRALPHGDGWVAAMFGIFGREPTFGSPKMFGRMMNETLGKIHSGQLRRHILHLHAVPLLSPQWLGMWRRYQAFVNDYTQPLIPLHRFITVAALFTGAAQLIFVVQPDS